MNSARIWTREQFVARLNVSRETEHKLDLLVSELERWQHVKNLVSHSTLATVWHRHIADSAQLLRLAPAPGPWLDIGSGGGFPGLVVAIQRTEAGSGRTYLLESNSRKCSFLRHVIRLVGADAEVLEGRIEEQVNELSFEPVVVSARAVASLDRLLGWTNGLLRKGAVGIFPKGQDVEVELEIAARSWQFSVEAHPSLTDSEGRILLVRMAREQSAAHA